MLSRAARTGARIKIRRYRDTLAGIVSAEDLARLEDCDRALGVNRRKRAAKRSPRTRRAVSRRGR